jgi:hypothetical protein
MNGWNGPACSFSFFFKDERMKLHSATTPTTTPFSNNTKKHAVRGALQSQRNQAHQPHRQLQHSPYGYTAEREQVQWT